MTHTMPQATGRKPKRIAGPRTFLVFNAVYLLVVFGPSLWIGRLGSDHANLAAEGLRLPLPQAMIWAEVRIFGGFLPAYHLVNLALLYGTMVCLFFFNISPGKINL